MNNGNLAARVNRALDQFPAYSSASDERFQVQGAVFLRNRSIPDKYYANHVEKVTASTPGEIASLIERVEVEFKRFRHRCFYIDRETPTEFEAWLVMDGYQRTDSLVMVLTEELRGRPKPHEIGLVETDAEWQALLDLIDLARKFDSAASETGDGHVSNSKEQRIAALRTVSPPNRYWLAHAAHEPRAFLSSWTSSDGIGILDDLYTHPDYRRRGLAICLSCVRSDSFNSTLYLRAAMSSYVLLIGSYTRLTYFLYLSNTTGVGTSIKVHPDGTGALKKRTTGHRKVPRRMDHQDSYGCRRCSNGHDLLAFPRTSP